MSTSSGPPSFEHGPPSAVRSERRALEWCALFAVIAVIWVTLPVAAGLLLGALMAFTFQPVYEALRIRIGRASVASLATVLGSALGIVGVVAGFGSLFIMRGVALTRSLLVAIGPGGALEERVHSITGLLSRVGLSVVYITEKLRDAASEIAGTSAAVAETMASATAGGLLGLFFALLAMDMFLRHWSTIVTELTLVSPLRPQYTLALLEELQRVGRTTLLGTLVTGLAQGLLATLGFWMTGAPEPVFFGIATALASLIPGIGTLLVWVPVGIFLIMTGRVGAGVSELVWGTATIVGVSDYIIRPRLVGDEAIPTLVTFIALFGGVEVFGLKGLVVGPVVMSLAVATLRMYAREAVDRRA